MSPPTLSGAPDDGARPATGTPAVGRLLPIALVLLAGLGLRLLVAYVLLPGEGLGSDLRLFVHWAQVLADQGPGGFYANAGFADYPPGYLYVLWAMGVAGHVLADALGLASADVIGVFVKLPAIAADMAIAILLYRAADRWWGSRAGLIAAALFLFIPVTWYDSALWGQVDAVGALLLLGAVLLLLEGWSEPAVAVATLAAVTKPQYAIGLAVVVAVLAGRHLLRPGSGPVPTLGRWTGPLDRRLDGWFTRRQGFRRLVASAVVGFAVLVVPIVPFDLPSLAPSDLAGVPVVGSIAGFVSLVGSAAAYYDVLTVNAFNGWALVGPTPLTHAIGHDYMWTYDSLAVLGDLSAATVGAGLLVLVTALVAVTLLIRDDRMTILVAFTVLAVAFFVLPTRVHERYLFPAFVTGALLAARSVRWRWWFLVLGIASVANLHAILTLPYEGYGTPGIQALPLGSITRQDIVVATVGITTTVLFVAALAAFVRESAWPAFAAVPGQLRQWRATDGALRLAAAVPMRPGTIDAAPVPAPAAGRVVGAHAGGTTTAATGWRVAGATGWRAALRPPAAGVGIDVGATRAGAPGSAGRSRARSWLSGRPGRRDLLVAVLLVAVAFGTRAWRLETPRTMYFDEFWHATTAMEFLQGWRYGIPHTITEWTHPHLAKYGMAAGLATLGNDTVTGLESVGAPVRAAVFEPSYVDPGRPDGLGGDRIVVATGTDLRVSEHGDPAHSTAIPLPGAAALAVDGDQHFVIVGTDDGTLWGFSSASLGTLAASGTPPTPYRIGSVDGPVRGVWAVGDGRLLVRTDGDRLLLVDEAKATLLATTTLPGVAGILPLTAGGTRFVIAATPTGLAQLDAATLKLVGTAPIAGGATGLDLVDGNAAEKNARELLLQPTLYVATGDARIVTVLVGPDGTLTAASEFPMPGAVTDVRWDRPTNLVHALGKTADGRSTIYVVDPHVNAVFADAVLPFTPTTWLLDVQPSDPGHDRQRALAFAPEGAVVSVDVGGHASAWRLPGVVIGALTIGLLYLLALILFRRRIVGLLLAAMLVADGLLFQQSRIAMNDVYVGFFIVAGFTLLAWFLGSTATGRRARLELLLVPPALGILFGLGLASKWVAAYAIGGAVLLFLLRSWLGRRLALAGMVTLTAVLGYLAVADDPPNFTFLLIMVGLTAMLGVGIVRGEAGGEPNPPDRPGPAWLAPRWHAALPIAWVVGCMAIVPLVVYVISYIPWALTTAGDPQLLAGWPAGHAGQTFLDLQAQMYAYHDEFRFPHGSGSPWWAWPLGLKPLWGYLETFVDGTQATILGAGDPFLLWMSIPALVAATWAAWRRRSWAIGFGIVAFLALWLPWARIDRVAFNYHYYVALPFAFLLLAWFLAELWERPTARLAWFARPAFAVVLYLPTILWLAKGPLCVVAGVDPAAAICTGSLADVAGPIVAWTAFATILVAVGIIGARPRRMVVVMLGLAAVTSIALYPTVAAMVMPNGLPWVYQGLLPTWDVTFRFASDAAPASARPLLGIGTLVVLVLVVGLTLVAMRQARRWGKGGPTGGPSGGGPSGGGQPGGPAPLPGSVVFPVAVASAAAAPRTDLRQPLGTTPRAASVVFPVAAASAADRSVALAGPAPIADGCRDLV